MSNIREALSGNYFLAACHSGDQFDATKAQAARSAYWYDFLNCLELNYETLTRTSNA